MMVADYRPVPREVLDSMSRERLFMLQQGGDISDLVSQISAHNPETQKKVTDALAKAISAAVNEVASGSTSQVTAKDVISAVSATISVAVDKALQSGKEDLAISVVTALPDAVHRASQELSKSNKISPSVASSLDDLARKLSEAISEASKPAIARAVSSVAVDELSEKDFRKLMDAISQMDLKQHGVGNGPGSGLLGGLVTRVMLSGRTRAYLRDRLQDLRTAAHYRQYSWPKGKRLDVRATMRKYMRTQIPFPGVYTTQLIRPKTREDIVFVVDVSGSMSVAYPMIYAVSKAMNDLGLNSRVYAFDTEVASGYDIEAILSKVGGGGTRAAPAIEAELHDLGDTLKQTSTIVYTDLEFEPTDFSQFREKLSDVRNRGSKVSVWVYDCDAVPDEVSALRKDGFHVVCDVKTLDDMLDAARQMKRDLIRRA